jgi:hypothetical protein
MSSNITLKPIHPREKYVMQYYFFETSLNLHDCVEKRIAIGKFGLSKELLDVAKKEGIRGS